MLRTSILIIGCVSVLAGCGRKPIEEVKAREHKPLEPIKVSENDWPYWRGPNRDGSIPSAEIPLKWSNDENVVWKSPVPGDGHASPIVVDGKVFVSTADVSDQVQSLICYSRETGEQLWQKPLHKGGFMHMHPDNSQASPTPASDGQRVFTAFINNNGLHVSAVDFDGNVLWQKEVEHFQSQHGYGASPVLYESFVIVNGDNPGAACIAALHRETGEIVWKIARPNTGTYATPIIGNIAGRDQLLLSGGNKITSYDPKTGTEIWFADGPSDTTANTMAFNGSHVYVSGGYPQKNIVCIRADGEGDVTKSHIEWTNSRGVSYVPSPLVAEEKIYFASDNGVLTCFDKKSGDKLWSKRLRGDVTSSFILVGDYLIITTERGETSIFNIHEPKEAVSVNSLDGTVTATPAVSGTRLFIRTKKHLYCLGS